MKSNSNWMSQGIRIFLFIAGCIAVILLVQKVGTDQLYFAVKQSASYLPFVFALELVQMALDAASTYFLYGSNSRKIPLGSLIRAQCIGTAVASMSPAGRTSEEITKAILLSRWTSNSDAAVAATSNQALTLVATGLISVPCLIASWRLTGGSLFTIALAVHTLALILLGIFIRGVVRSNALREWLKTHSPKVHSYIDQFQRISAQGQLIPVWPLFFLFLGRLVQVVQYGILIYAVGGSAGALEIFMAQGLNLLALAAGTFVPAQLGVSDSIFLLASQSLSLSEAQAVAITTQLHLIQVAVIVMGTFFLMWKGRVSEVPKPVP